MRYLPISVYSTTYEHYSNSDCTMGGVSSTHRHNLVVPCEDGHVTEEDVREHGYKVLELGTKRCGDKTFYHFKPEGETRWTMCGGNFAYTSDSRFSQKYGHAPVSIHDRIES